MSSDLALVMRVSQLGTASAPFPTLSLPRHLTDEQFTSLVVTMRKSYPSGFRVQPTDDEKISVTFRPLFEFAADAANLADIAEVRRV